MATSCNTFRLGNRSILKDDYYVDAQKEPVYVAENDGVIMVFPSEKEESDSSVLEFNSYYDEAKKVMDYQLRKNTFDLDLITIPIRFRPQAGDLPAQLSTDLSVALFSGFRKDFHTIRYEKRPFPKYKRRVINKGFSLGLVSGFSNTAIDETTTSFNQDKEYAGIAWFYGAGWIVGVNNLTIGLVFGKDVLLDKNRKFWIYDRKFWYGVSVGLNLN